MRSRLRNARLGFVLTGLAAVALAGCSEPDSTDAPETDAAAPSERPDSSGQATQPAANDAGLDGNGVPMHASCGTGAPPDPSSIVWETTPIVLSGGLATDVYEIVNRNIRSDDATKPAVLLDNYRGKVVIRHSNFFGYTAPGTAHGIIGSTAGARLDIESSNFYSGNPMHAGWSAGRSVLAEGFKEFRMVSCSHFGTSGVALVAWAGTADQMAPTITMTDNYFRNIDGRISDPTAPGGYKVGNKVNEDFYYAQMLQLNKCSGVPRVLVQDNEVCNEAGHSRTEDVVSFYVSSGTPESPMVIDRNLFTGEWVYDAWFDPAKSPAYGNNMPDGTPGKTDKRGYPNSGGGGLLGDGAGAAPRGYLDDPAYLRFTRNTVLGMSNYGLGAAAGHDMTIEGNVILRSGFVRGITRDVQIPWHHVPLQLQDYSTGGGKSIDDGTGTNTNRVRWYDIDVIDNTYGYTYVSAFDGTKGNAGLLLSSPVRTSSGNHDVTTDPSTPYVTRAMEDQAELAHRQAWVAAGVRVGAE